MLKMVLNFPLVLLSIFTITSAVPTNKDMIQAGPVLPAVLTGDQSFPANNALPIDAIPKDMMTGDMGQSSNHVVPQVTTSMNNIESGQVPIQTNFVPEGQVKYPISMNSGNNNAVSGMTNNGNVMNKVAATKGVTNMDGNANYSPAVGHINLPMTMNFMQWGSAMPSNIVLMNIQMACSSLQHFVLGTPLAEQIMTSVTNMNNMAEIFNSPKQCGLPALSDALRMFLKTCNLYSSCSNPTYGPLPEPTQPRSQAVPYSVQQTEPMSKPLQVMPKAQRTYQPPLTPTVGPNYSVVQTPVMRMFNWLYNSRSPQIQKQSNGTVDASGNGDD